jgi:hypothetical protein
MVCKKELKKILNIIINKEMNRRALYELIKNEWKQPKKKYSRTTYKKDSPQILYGINNIFPVLLRLSRSLCASAPSSKEKRVGSSIRIFLDMIHSNNSAALFFRSS